MLPLAIAVRLEASSVQVSLLESRHDELTAGLLGGCIDFVPAGRPVTGDATQMKS